MRNGDARTELDNEQKTSLTPRDALELAVQAHRAGRLDVAAALYDRILAAAPDYAPALHFFGLLLHEAGDSEAAIGRVRQAIENEPDDPGMHNNLGNILSEIQRPAQAAEAYMRAVALAPDHSDAWSNFGVALRALDRTEEAEAAYRKAIKADPRHREAHDNLGRLLSSVGRIQEAVKCHAIAMELEPRNADSRRRLSAGYAALGETEKARHILEDWLADEPSSPTAHHLLAAVTGENVPERANDTYVETLFDRFAASFDRKLASLQYRAPELVVEAVTRARAPAGTALILDAGCGTGLCGPLLKPYARQLVGVDLSGNMLIKARQRGAYDKLVKAELTEFLAASEGEYDIIVSADTLCYFGALDTVARAAAAALCAGGVLAFTVEEETGGDEFRLNPHGRYSHRHDYVERALTGAGFNALSFEQHPLRMERGEPALGFVVTARKLAS